MSLKYGKAELAAIEAVLDAEHETLGEAAKAVLLAAEAVFEKRAKFVVVGQLLQKKGGELIKPWDDEAIKLALGWYATEGDARAASESLWHNTASGDTFRTWVLNVHHGTAAEFHTEQKNHYKALEIKQKAAGLARRLDIIEKFKIKREKQIADFLATDYGRSVTV